MLASKTQLNLRECHYLYVTAIAGEHDIQRVMSGVRQSCLPLSNALNYPCVRFTTFIMNLQRIEVANIKIVRLSSCSF